MWTMDKYQFTLLQLVVSGLLVLLQLSTIPVFLFYRDLRNRILYRIMLSISLSDFLQLFAIFQFTAYEALGWRLEGTATEKFASGVFIIAWDHLIIQHFLLALNRFCIILKAYYSPTSHKKESSMENGLFNFLLILSWLLMAGLQVVFMSPLCGGIWNQEAVGFFYDEKLECSEIYRDSELYFTIAFPAVSIGFYVAIIVMLKKTRSFGTPNQQQNQQQNQQKNKQQISASSVAGVLNRQEKQILILSGLLFTIITALIFAWYIDYQHPPWTMLFCGYLLVNTSLTLIMNSEFRHRYQRMWQPLIPFCGSPANWQNKSRQKSDLVVKLNVPQQTRPNCTNTSGALFIRRTEEGQKTY